MKTLSRTDRAGWVARLMLLAAAAVLIPACLEGDEGPSGSLDAWGKLGTADTVDGVNFVGTTDNVAFNVRVNNERVLRFEPATSPNVIAGHSANAVTTGVRGAAICGGGANLAANAVTDDYGFVGGGSDNQAGDAAGTTLDSICATVGGGFMNTASADWSTVTGGSQNTASGDYASVPGGYQNDAVGVGSLAAGNRAKANHDGCFVWGDQASLDFASSATNEFSVRSSGGVRFVTQVDGFGVPTAGVSLAAGGSAWAVISDRDAKDNILDVDGREILERLKNVPVSTWNYKSQDSSIRHIGPMAQDFHAAFGVGPDERSITTLDADGVALAAVKGLHALLEEKDKRISDLEARLAALEKALGKKSGD